MPSLHCRLCRAHRRRAVQHHHDRRRCAARLPPRRPVPPGRQLVASVPAAQRLRHVRRVYVRPDHTEHHVSARPVPVAQLLGQDRLPAGQEGLLQAVPGCKRNSLNRGFPSRSGQQAVVSYCLCLVSMPGQATLPSAPHGDRGSHRFHCIDVCSIIRQRNAHRWRIGPIAIGCSGCGLVCRQGGAAGRCERRRSGNGGGNDDKPHHRGDAGARRLHGGAGDLRERPGLSSDAADRRAEVRAVSVQGEQNYSNLVMSRLLYKIL